MEALLTLLFFVVLWAASKGLKRMGRNSPELRALSDSLSRGERPAEPNAVAGPGQDAGDSPSVPRPQPQAQQSTTTKLTP